jgi:predicted LPLAT superfamily acyltransferase
MTMPGHPSDQLSPAWKQNAERSNLRIMRFMIWLSLAAGRRLSRVVLYGIAAYFFFFGGPARQASKVYLRRVLGKRPSPWHGFLHVLHFATVIHDRIYFLRGDFSLFDVNEYGQEEFHRDQAQRIPVLLMGGHLGSFELLRAMAENTGLQVSMLMYQENAAKLNAALAALRPDSAPRVISLQRVDAMLIAQQDLAAGRVLGLLADRRLAHERADVLDFLGAPAAFPRNPFRLASILKCKVYFMAGLYLGRNRYAIHFAPVADFTQCATDPGARRDREARIAAAQSAYVAALEKFTRMAVFNWFNFFDFWNDSRASERPRVDSE